MGLHGSSTTALIFQDVKVPAENVLSEVGKGPQGRVQRAELRALQAGRDVRRRRASARSPRARATPRPAASSASRSRSFGAIKHKIGEMVVRTYAIESLLYRTAGLVDARIAATPHEAERRIRGARRLRGIRRRGVDRQGRRQRGARLRARRERPDPRRQRLRARLPRRAPRPRRAREPHLRRHQRDQPPADSRHADPPRASRATSPLIPAAKALQDELLGPPSMPSPATATACSPTSVARSRRSRRPR